MIHYNVVEIDRVRNPVLEAASNDDLEYDGFSSNNSL